MSKYNYEYLEKQIISKLPLDKDSSLFIISLYNDGNIQNYELHFDAEDKDVPEIVQNVKQAILEFFSTFISNPNFDHSNFKNNLNRNVVIGIEMGNGNPNAGVTVFDENKNLLGIFAEHSLVDTGVIFHELFHFASRPANSHQFSRGLKEGYTEALTHRYFTKTKLAYPEDVKYSLELEQIVGQNVMENAYSKGEIIPIQNAIGLEVDDQTFFNFNQSLDLMLGSYQRQNARVPLKNEVQKAKQASLVAQACLDIFAKNSKIAGELSNNMSDTKKIA